MTSKWNVDERFAEVSDDELIRQYKFILEYMLNNHVDILEKAVKEYIVSQSEMYRLLTSREMPKEKSKKCKKKYVKKDISLNGVTLATDEGNWRDEDAQQ